MFFFFSQSSGSYSIFNSSFRECDAVIVTTSYNYESVSLDAMKQWLSGIQKEIHVLGPLLPPGYGIETQNTEEGASVDIETFLGEMLGQHGKRSVFFVRCFSLLSKFLSVPTNFSSGFLWNYPLDHSFGIY
jgi:hypothetical protein